METKKLIARKLFAILAFVAIAAVVFLVAPPATRLIIALLALPLEALIVVALISDEPRQSSRTFQRTQHSPAD